MERKKIGLALSGGGARGFAHIGVLKVLVENNIPIDMIAGTSAGSIIGGAFAAGMAVDEIDTMAANAGWTTLVRPSFSIGGMLSNAPMGVFLKKYLPVSQFEDLTMPFSAVAFDLATNSQVTLTATGSMITAIRASCAVPGVFTAVRDEQRRYLVDGGVVSPLPVQTVLEMGADIVIAIDVISCGATFRASSRTGFGTVMQGAMALLRVATLGEQAGADVVIEPAIAHIRPDQLGARSELIELGEKAARDALSRLQEVI